MNVRYAAILLLSLYPSFGAASHLVPDHSCRLQDARAATRQQVLACQYELEMRHAGGPRKEVLEGLLQRAAELQDPDWGRRVVEACVAHYADCNEFTATAAAMAEREKTNPEVARSLAKRIHDESALQAMTPERRRGFYLAALTQGFAKEDDIGLDYRNAAVRIVGERMLDLLPRVRSESAKWLNPPSELLKRKIELVQTMAAPNVEDRLVDMVRDGISHPGDGVTQLLAIEALQELRVLNRDGTDRRLKQLLDLYEPAAQEAETRRKQVILKRDQERVSLLSQERAELERGSHLGLLRKKVIEAIGDLGDREFERTAIGGTTLWDSVHESETALAKRGQLSPKDMVTVAPSTRN